MSRPPTLLEALALVPDPRSRRGRIHPLASVLGLAVVATLAGCNSLDAIAQFGRLHGLPLAHALGFRRAKTPNKSALGEIFRRLDVAALERALRTWLEGRGALAGDHVALDGKTLVGSKSAGLPGRHLLAAYATAHAAVVGQLEVAETTNEHKAALGLLGVVPLAGKVVTADAMFTHADVCDTIADAGGDYVLSVKKNQETLRADIAAVFEGDGTAFPPYQRRLWRGNLRSVTVTNKGHGRRERRTVTTSTWLNEYHRRWPKLAQVVRVRRERQVRGETTVEVAYYITSLDRERAGAARLGQLIRSHWEVENRLHHVRDVTLGEDASRVRSNSSPRVLAALRSAAVHLLNGVKATSKAAARRRFAALPHEALRLLTT